MNSTIKRVHIIAMGGSVMHALAITLKKQGLNVTGSDDDFSDPSKSRLETHDLLPAYSGWNQDIITKDIDVVILGMHAHVDNPELKKAKSLGLDIISFPEFIYQQSKNKQRIVIGGSHGKTTITAMVMHVLRHQKRDFDYVVGAKVTGFEETVKLTDAPVIVIEGDEYLSSRIDNTPKFLHYQHHIGLISGIAWDHVNVFPTEADYKIQFDLFADATPKAGSLVYNSEDPVANTIGSKERSDVLQLPYTTHPYEIIAGETYLLDGEQKIKLKIFGEHNLLNLSGAKEVLSRLSVTNTDFYDAIKSFELPNLRLNTIISGDNYTVFRDYAHAPSKVLASANAVKSQFPDRKLIGVFELHTYSSLNKEFFGRYRDTMNACDKAVVFYNPKAVEQKKLSSFDANEIQNAFNHVDLEVINNSEELAEKIKTINNANTSLLLMSSSNFGGLNLSDLFN